MIKNLIQNQNVGIIGNASLLLEKDCSEHIDSNTTVIRINRGIPTHPYQGSKFDILCYSGDNLIKDIMNEIPKKVFKLNAKTEIDQKFLLDLKQKLNLTTKKQKPSTGLLLLSYILSFKPKQVNLYGFDWNKTKTYYEEDFYKKTDIVWSSHLYQNEESLIREFYCKEFDVKIYE